MSIASSTPDVPGAPGEKRAEATTSSALPAGVSATGEARGAQEPGIEEDWLSLATGDPALWLKQ